MPPKIVPWQTWGKDPPRFESPSVGPSRYVFFVNSNTRPCFDGFLCIGQAKYIQRLHTTKRDCPDVRYNFMIGGDGLVYEGRGWRIKPSLPQRYSKVSGLSVLIAFIGTFLETETPSIMFETRVQLVRLGMEKHHITPRHSQISLPQINPRELP